MTTTDATQATSIRVALLDDHRLVRETLIARFEQAGLEVALASGDSAEFLDRLDPSIGVAVVDLMLDSNVDSSGQRGLETLDQIRARYPELRTVVLSAINDAQIVDRCYRAGAHGYLFKVATGLGGLVDAIVRVARGEKLFPVEMFSRTPTPPSVGSQALSRLTSRERDVLACVAAGHDNLKIGAMLGISERTVKTHVAAVYRKLDAENRVQLALLARQLGISPRS